MDPLAYVSDVGAVVSRLLQKPLLVLKPKSTFMETDPLFFELFLLIGFTIFLYIRTKQTNNLSWVDRVRPVMPAVYSVGMVLHQYFHTGSVNHRLGLLFMLQASWGIRLAYNLYSKNGYKDTYEDYRWELIRTWFNGKPTRYEFFVLFVNVVAQVLIIFGFSVLPTYVVYKSGLNKATGSQSLFDLLLLVLFGVFFVIETLGDYQMYEFQQMKKHVILSRQFSNIRPEDQGFIKDGLYRYSRHPNYFGELGIWLTIYLYSCVVAPLNWSVIGYLGLVLVFWYSIGITEDLSTFKYPPYKYYARRTSCLIPWFPGQSEKKKKQ